MRFIRRITTSLLGGCLLTVAADGLLASVGAAYGWYYGVGICVTGLVTYRILIPAIGVPVRPRWTIPGGRDKSESHLPRAKV